MNTLILNTDKQEFINKKLNSNTHTLILKGSAFEGVDIKELTEQIEAKKKCESKLKTWPWQDCNGRVSSWLDQGTHDARTQCRTSWKGFWDQLMGSIHIWKIVE